ncbi:MAG TPA: hypothetical protein VEW46_18615 [Pyrinomonadaceae bacterium]|nr:hypothetical protein [Pyrinomonadaceae bacterium]
MASFSLASYTLRIRNTEEKEWEYLDDFGEPGRDLLTVLSDYLTALGTEISLDNETKKLIKLRPPLGSKDRILSGILQTGEWGYTTEIQDVETGDITYNRKTKESENYPYYFLIYVPKLSQRGVVILQRFGNKGIRTQLLTDFQAYFSTQFEDFGVRINPLAPGSVVDQYLSNQGRVTAIRLIRFYAPDDIASLYEGKDEALSDVYTELIIHAGGDEKIPIFPRVKAVLEGKRQIKNLVEIENFEPQVVKLNIDYGGKPRVIDLGRPNEMRAYEDITDKVETGIDGHPTFNSIDKLARELLIELTGLLKIPLK